MCLLEGVRGGQASGNKPSPTSPPRRFVLGLSFQMVCGSGIPLPCSLRRPGPGGLSGVGAELGEEGAGRAWLPGSALPGARFPSKPESFSWNPSSSPGTPAFYSPLSAELRSSRAHSILFPHPGPL